MRLLSIVAMAAMLAATAVRADDCPAPLEPNLGAEFHTGCTLNWPPDDGFHGTPKQVRLEAGTLVDRFVAPVWAANDNGRYFSPVGEAYSRRALPYVCKAMAYTVYRVRQPVVMLAGEIAPWFGENGGGTQYRADAGVQDLVKRGDIEALPSQAAPPCDK